MRYYGNDCIHKDKIPDNADEPCYRLDGYAIGHVGPHGKSKRSDGLSVIIRANRYKLYRRASASSAFIRLLN